jgi:hypothetical protein
VCCASCVANQTQESWKAKQALREFGGFGDGAGFLEIGRDIR